MGVVSMKPTDTAHTAWGPGPTLSRRPGQAQRMAGMQNLTMGAWPWGHFVTGGTLIRGQLMTSH